MEKKYSGFRACLGIAARKYRRELAFLCYGADWDKLRSEYRQEIADDHKSLQFLSSVDRTLTKKEMCSTM